MTTSTTRPRRGKHAGGATIGSQRFKIPDGYATSLGSVATCWTHWIKYGRSCLSLSDYSLEIAKAKFRAIKRAEKRLLQRLDMIDWEYETLRPAVKEIEKAATEGKLPTFELTDGTSKNRK